VDFAAAIIPTGIMSIPALAADLHANGVQCLSADGRLLSIKAKGYGTRGSTEKRSIAIVALPNGTPAPNPNAMPQARTFTEVLCRDLTAFLKFMDEQERAFFLAPSRMSPEQLRAAAIGLLDFKQYLKERWTNILPPFGTFEAASKGSKTRFSDATVICAVAFTAWNKCMLREDFAGLPDAARESMRLAMQYLAAQNGNTPHAATQYLDVCAVMGIQCLRPGCNRPGSYEGCCASCGIFPDNFPLTSGKMVPSPAFSEFCKTPEVRNKKHKDQEADFRNTHPSKQPYKKEMKEGVDTASFLEFLNRNQGIITPPVALASGPGLSR
jgi:hypothetical protein